MLAKHIMGMFIIAIMVLSAFGFVMNYNSTNTERYNGYKFTGTQQGWMTEINDERTVFQFLPQDLEQLDLPAGLEGKKAIVITYDPNAEEPEKLAELQYYAEQKLTQLTDTYPQRALTNSTGTTLAEANCADGTASMPVIMLEITNTTQVTKKGNCWKFKAQTPYSMLQQIEKLVYILAGVL